MKQLRTLVKKAVEIIAPQMLFEFRLRKYRNDEPELTLVPHLCDPRLAAVDVGANWGLYTGIMARHARRCYSFEANPELVQMLRNIGLRGVDVIHAAVSDRRGQITLRIPRNGWALATVEQHNALSDAPSDTGIDEVVVPARRLDDCRFDPVGLIKIDVEGHEEAVLRGAEKLIARDRPFLIVECEDRHNPGTASRVRQWLESRGYGGWVWRGGKLTPLDMFRIELHQTAEQRLRHDGSYINNFVFAHESKLARLASLL